MPIAFPNTDVNYKVVSSTTRPSSPSDGLMIYETDTGLVLIYNGNAWVCITPQSANVATSQTETSTSYDDLTTVGPAVTVATDTTALVTISSRVSNDNSLNTSWISFAVSGATTSAATDARGARSVGANPGQQHRVFKMTGLTAGDNTFTMKYRVTATTGTFDSRDITVVGLP